MTPGASRPVPLQVLFASREGTDLVVDCLRRGEPWTVVLSGAADVEQLVQFERWAEELADGWLTETTVDAAHQRLVLWSGSVCVALDVARVGSD